MNQDWTTWVKENPPPDLQALITTFGTFSGIPPWAWGEWDRLNREWEAKRRSHLLGSATWQMRPTKKKRRQRPQKYKMSAKPG